MKFVFALLAVFLITAFLSTAFAFEAPITNFGFNEIEISSSLQKQCQTIDIDLLNLPLENEKANGILSIQANFVGTKNDSSYVSVKINSGQEQVIWPEYFSCKTECWARVFLPQLKSVPTEIQICLATGGETSKATISEKSFVGLYDTPVLTIENISPEGIILGERAQMKIIAKNTGTKDADIFVQFIAQDLRSILKITSFDIVDGEASASTTISPNQTKEFVYYIKPTLISSYNLPSAILFFQNIFDEEQPVMSNHPQLNVLSPEQITLFLVEDEQKENPFTFKIMAKNNWDKPFFGVMKILPGDIIIGSASKEISLEPKSEKEFSFTTKKLLAGNYSIIAEIDVNQDHYISNSISFPVKEEGRIFEILFAIVGVIVGLGIFFWISFWKGKI